MVILISNMAMGQKLGVQEKDPRLLFFQNVFSGVHFDSPPTIIFENQLASYNQTFPWGKFQSTKRFVFAGLIFLNKVTPGGTLPILQGVFVVHSEKGARLEEKRQLSTGNVFFVFGKEL